MRDVNKLITRCLALVLSVALWGLCLYDQWSKGFPGVESNYGHMGPFFALALPAAYLAVVASVIWFADWIGGNVAGIPPGLVTALGWFFLLLPTFLFFL
jgi:hypothetical protein